ncbi:MAG: amino acid ABC transporter permease [Treponema sp.]|nr:amino acid ABC transporter permease [Treponema sp.]
MMFNLEYFWDSLRYGITYFPVTLQLAFVPLGLSIVFGTAIALVRLYRVPVLAKIFDLLVPFYNGIPVIVTLLIYHLVYLTMMKPIPNGTMAVALFTFSLERICITTETVRGAFQAIPRGQYESAYACGLSGWQTLRRIVIPQVIPVALPGFTNGVAGALKNTSIVITLGINDVLNGALIPGNETYSFLEGYVAAAVIYWVFCSLLEFMLHKVERALTKNRNGGKKK